MVVWPLGKSDCVSLANGLEVFSEVYRVLKPTASFWLNIGDSYLKKRLLGIPWRVAFVMMDSYGWGRGGHMMGW